MFRLVTDALLQRDKQTKWPVWQLSSAGNAHLQRDSCDKSLLPWHEPRAKRYTLSHPHTYAQCVVRCSWVRMDLHLNLCLPKFTGTHLCLCLPKFVQQIRPNDNRLCPYHSLPSPHRDEAPHLYSFWRDYLRSRYFLCHNHHFPLLILTCNEPFSTDAALLAYHMHNNHFALLLGFWYYAFLTLFLLTRFMWSWTVLTAKHSEPYPGSARRCALSPKVCAASSPDGSADRFMPGASGLPYYCAPLVCVPNVQGGLAVWLQQANPKQTINFSALSLPGPSISSPLLLLLLLLERPADFLAQFKKITRKYMILEHNCLYIIIPKRFFKIPSGSQPGERMSWGTVYICAEWCARWASTWLACVSRKVLNMCCVMHAVSCFGDVRLQASSTETSVLTCNECNVMDEYWVVKRVKHVLHEI